LYGYRFQTICNTDAKSSSPKNLRKRKLFSEDKSSSTSKFDPGDYVSPKYVRKGKKHAIKLV